jgi:hypothetical protein
MGKGEPFIVDLCFKRYRTHASCNSPGSQDNWPVRAQSAAQVLTISAREELCNLWPHALQSLHKYAQGRIQKVRNQWKMHAFYLAREGNGGCEENALNFILLILYELLPRLYYGRGRSYIITKFFYIFVMRPSLSICPQR